MSGKDLYNQYVQIQLSYNCAVDSWEELDAKDKAVWEQLSNYMFNHTTLTSR